MEFVKNCKKVLFWEARCHCRHKTILDLFLKDIDVNAFKNKSFAQVFLEIHALKRPKGSIGTLTLYDIASDIVRHNGGCIDKVYIIGSGPKRAIKLLDIKKQRDNSTGLYFVTCEDVVSKCNLEPTSDGDLLETYICQWQKGVPVSESRF
jgi:hypothetical protein